MSTNKFRHLAIVVVVLSLPLINCSDRDGESSVATPASAAPLPANTNAAASDNQFFVSGPLIVEHQLELLAQRDGVVSKLLQDVGGRVHSGEVLAELDDRQLSADLEAAHARTLATEADLNNWKAEAKVLEVDYERARKLWNAQLITQEQLEHAQFKAEADQWDVKRVEQLLVNAKQTENSLDLELQKTRIRAPFDGIVARRYVREGQQIVKGDRLFWVTAEGPLRMRFTLPEKFVGHVQRGQELSLSTPDLPAQEFKARVLQVSPVVDPASSTIDVVVELEGNTKLLRPGMDAKARFNTVP
ncbi:MAG TPA: efflux RND transporter periplasmic adaptor subunit [Candidatus Sulfotelmatobacter sp.]|nr:efflux RND transporter periplasmic adaptor subunit [Candidatus Sulfotelmatobacter sp.]